MKASNEEQTLKDDEVFKDNAGDADHVTCDNCVTGPQIENESKTQDDDLGAGSSKRDNVDELNDSKSCENGESKSTGDETNIKSTAQVMDNGTDKETEGVADTLDARFSEDPPSLASITDRFSHLDCQNSKKLLDLAVAAIRGKATLTVDVRRSGEWEMGNPYEPCGVELHTKDCVDAFRKWACSGETTPNSQTVVENSRHRATEKQRRRLLLSIAILRAYLKVCKIAKREGTVLILTCSRKCSGPLEISAMDSDASTCGEQLCHAQVIRDFFFTECSTLFESVEPAKILHFGIRFSDKALHETMIAAIPPEESDGKITLESLHAEIGRGVTEIGREASCVDDGGGDEKCESNDDNSTTRNDATNAEDKFGVSNGKALSVSHEQEDNGDVNGGICCQSYYATSTRSGDSLREVPRKSMIPTKSYAFTDFALEEFAMESYGLSNDGNLQIHIPFKREVVLDASLDTLDAIEIDDLRERWAIMAIPGRVKRRIIDQHHFPYKTKDCRPSDTIMGGNVVQQGIIPREKAHGL